LVVELGLERRRSRLAATAGLLSDRSQYDNGAWTRLLKIGSHPRYTSNGRRKTARCGSGVGHVHHNSGQQHVQQSQQIRQSHRATKTHRRPPDD
ncbi:MAG: hypothetical protein ABGZ35_04345, partial [Planctomycetaceae bacterium]